MGELFDDYEANTRDEAVSAFNDAGMSMADFLYVYGKYSEIYSKDMNATAKATEFAHWINGEDYTPEQAAVIKEELAYFNMSPASSKSVRQDGSSWGESR